MSRVVVYTDGACSKNGNKNAIASWAMWFPSRPDWSDAQRVDGSNQTNNRGELSAILSAFKKIRSELGTGCNDIDVIVYTDSDYSKNCLTKWVSGWIRKGWVTASGTAVLNRDLIEATLALQPQFRSVTYEYVRAHTGGKDEHSLHNDRVDRMARRVIDPSVTLPEEVAAPPPSEPTLGDCPLQRMGPAVSKEALVSWVRSHLDSLDKESLDKALLKALADTYAKKQLKMETRKGMVSLTSGLQVESIVVTKEE